MSLRDDYVMALEAENEALRDKILRMEEGLGMRLEVPPLFGLTGQEAKVFGILLKRELVTKQQALDALYGDRPESDEAEIKIVDVFVCKLRKKLKPFGVAVETVWGRGYRMSAESKNAAAVLLDEARAS